MKLTILQHDIIWCNPEANLSAIETHLDTLSPAQLYVLPEMFATGFIQDPRGTAQHEGGESLEWMRRTATRLNAAIAGSLAVESGGAYTNRLYFVEPSGKVSFYDKHHLFTYSGEHKLFTAGNTSVTITYLGVRIRLMVCYDLRFPVWSRNNNDYDLAIYVASWPTSRIAVWSTLLRARAIENQCYVVGVNRVGNDPYCNYCGGSVIIDAYGNTLAACQDNTTCAATADINLEALRVFRAKFPVLEDADTFMLNPPIHNP